LFRQEAQKEKANSQQNESGNPGCHGGHGGHGKVHWGNEKPNSIAHDHDDPYNKIFLIDVIS